MTDLLKELLEKYSAGMGAHDLEEENQVNQIDENPPVERVKRSKLRLNMIKG